MDKENFYFNGLYYDTEDDLLLAASHHEKSKITPVSLQRIIDDFFRKNVILNLFTLSGQDYNISNGEMAAILARPGTVR